MDILTGIFIGLPIGFFLARFLVPFFDAVLEYLQNAVSLKTANKQAKIQVIAFNLENYCSPKNPQIGFDIADCGDVLGLDDEDEEDNDEIGEECKIESIFKTNSNMKSEIGFKM
jgi:hypothetical protein